jgi:hypothetical protein
MLHIKMVGEIDEVRIPGNFQLFVENLNVAQAAGKAYIMMQDYNEKPMALNSKNILIVRETDDDPVGMIG